MYLPAIPCVDVAAFREELKLLARPRLLHPAVGGNKNCYADARERQSDSCEERLGKEMIWRPVARGWRLQ